jgi:hypothetical protein
VSEPQSAEAVRAGDRACGQCGRTGTASCDVAGNSTLYSWPHDGAERYICRSSCLEPTPDGFLVPPENDLTVRKLGAVIDDNPADGQDCQASHCPPSAYQDCDWPRCAETA